MTLSLKRMAGFRNIAEHDYQVLVPILSRIIEEQLDELLDYSSSLRRGNTLTGP